MFLFSVYKDYQGHRVMVKVGIMDSIGVKVRVEIRVEVRVNSSQIRTLIVVIKREN